MPFPQSYSSLPLSYIRITRHLYESFLTWAKREYYFCTFWMRAGTWLRGFAGIVWWGSIMGREKRRDTYTHKKKIVCHRAARYGTTSGWSVVHINRKHQQCGNTNNPLRTNVLWYHKSRKTDRLGSKDIILLFTEKIFKEKMIEGETKTKKLKKRRRNKKEEVGRRRRSK